MLMNNTFLFAVLCILSYGCSANLCSADTAKNIKTFKNNLKDIGKVERRKLRMTVNDYEEKISYLDRTSGISSMSRYGHMTGYDSYKVYKDDKKKYLNWLSINKCRLTDKYVDSALNTSK